MLPAARSWPIGCDPDLPSCWLHYLILLLRYVARAAAARCVAPRWDRHRSRPCCDRSNMFKRIANIVFKLKRETLWLLSILRGIAIGFSCGFLIGAIALGICFAIILLCSALGFESYRVELAVGYGIYFICLIWSIVSTQRLWRWFRANDESWRLSVFGFEVVLRKPASSVDGFTLAKDPSRMYALATLAFGATTYLHSRYDPTILTGAEGTPFNIALFVLDLFLRGGLFDFMEHFDLKIGQFKINHGHIWYSLVAFSYRLYIPLVFFGHSVTDSKASAGIRVRL